MIDTEIYDADYYERGPITGKSCYENYRWIPELTIPMAMTIIDHLKIQRHANILDFGCAKGYLVKAFRLLYRQAFGIDISQYALENADPQIADFCKPHGGYSIFPPRFDYTIAKDVFEHIYADDLSVILEKKLPGQVLFAVIPLGEDGKFRAPANNKDATHVTCMPEEWWTRFFSRCGWAQEGFDFRIPGIKDNYFPDYPTAHGFFILIKN